MNGTERHTLRRQELSSRRAGSALEPMELQPAARPSSGASGGRQKPTAADGSDDETDSSDTVDQEALRAAEAAKWHEIIAQKYKHRQLLTKRAAESLSVQDELDQAEQTDVITAVMQLPAIVVGAMAPFEAHAEREGADVEGEAKGTANPSLRTRAKPPPPRAATDAHGLPVFSRKLIVHETKFVGPQLADDPDDGATSTKLGAGDEGGQERRQEGPGLLGLMAWWLSFGTSTAADGKPRSDAADRASSAGAARPGDEAPEPSVLGFLFGSKDDGEDREAMKAPTHKPVYVAARGLPSPHCAPTRHGRAPPHQDESVRLLPPCASGLRLHRVQRGGQPGSSSGGSRAVPRRPRVHTQSA